MGLRVVTPPVLEPITLAEAKDHLRVDLTDDDTKITSYIRTAREFAEKHTNRAAVERTLELSFEAFPQIIRLPQAPLVAIDSIDYTDSAGNPQMLDPAAYEYDTTAEPGLLRCVGGTSWPATDGSFGAVTILYRAGYGAVSEVPEEFKHLIKFLVAHYYENPEVIITGTIVAKVPLGVESLMRSLWVPDLA